MIPELRVMSAEEVAEDSVRCGARPSPRSTARCEDKPGHWRWDDALAETHKGRTRHGYWKFWLVTEEEMQDDS